MRDRPSRRDLLKLGLAAGAGLALPVDGAMAQGRSAPSTRPAAGRPYLDAALRTASYLRSARVETPRGFLWLQGLNRPAGLASSPDLYSGGAGPILFLLALHRATGDDAHLQEALGGADYIAATLPETPSREDGYGLYSGLAGIGLALERAAEATGEARLGRAADRVVEKVRAGARPAGAGIEWGASTDVISGGAGIGFWLLDRARATRDPLLLDLAARAGLRLLELATPAGPGAKKWLLPGSAGRSMPNFSHGTAGIATYLAALYLATGDAGFLDGALAGARHLRSIAQVDGDACLIYRAEPDSKDVYYLSWCHGPAGTARLFRALSLATGEAEWDGWVRKGANGIEASGIPGTKTSGFWNNAGLCCGSAGVAAFFLDLYAWQTREQDLAFARRMLDDLLAHAVAAGGGLSWPHAENRTEPGVVYAQTGLMQGAAGVGLALLQMDAATRGRRWDFHLPDSPWGKSFGALIAVAPAPI